jgi:hypothetical protein
VTATLHSASPWIVVTEANGTFPAAVEGDTTVSAPDDFRVTILAGAPIEVPQDCYLLVSGSGYVDSVCIPLVIGDSMNLPAGPDAYGYRIYDHTDSAFIVPRYDWFEARGQGTRLTLGDDQTVTLPLPERFGRWRYYGRTYDSISVCSNGWVAPGTTERCDFVNVILPYTGAPPNIVAFMWDNLNPAVQGAVWVADDPVNDRLIIEFDSVPYFAPADKWEKVQLQLHGGSVPTPTGDNAISVHFKTLNYYRTGTVGLQNSDGTAGLTHMWDVWYPRVSAPVDSGLALLFQTEAAAAVADPAEPPGASGAILAAFPNPSNGVTRLRAAYWAGEPVPVRLVDALGRTVRTLRQAAPYGVTWDGRDELGVRVSTGVYFAESEVGGRRIVTRVAVVH